MQIRGLHKTVYRLYAYARTQECLDVYRRRYEQKVWAWENLKVEGVSDARCQHFAGISRSTYYRYRRVLSDLERGISPPSKHPRRVNRPRWGEADRQLVLRVRRENPTYGKDKIAVILRRDHRATLSASTVGRIIRQLFDRGLIQKSRSASRSKKKRDFRKSHARPWTYKDYGEMRLGERVQVDHMTVCKNGVACKITRAAAAIHLGLQDTLYLGNLDAVRDWGHARDFVDGMWRILQQDKPDDYVLATGESRSVREFVEAAFARVKRSVEWRGEGVDEEGVDPQTGDILVRVDPQYFRPTELFSLRGDYSKAKRVLGWLPTWSAKWSART